MDFSRFIYLIINNSFRILPIIVLCYIPFIYTLTSTAKIVIARISITYFFIMLLYAAVITNIGININSDILNYSFMALSYFYFRKTIKEGRQKINFIFFIGLHTGVALAAIINTVNVLTILAMQAETSSVQYLTITLIFCVVIYAVIGLVMHRKIAPNLRWINSRDMNWLWVIPVLFTVIQYSIFSVFFGSYTTGSFYTEQYEILDMVNFIYPVISVLFFVISFFVYFIVVKMLESAGINVRLETEAALANEQKAALEKLNKMKTDFLHDIKHEIRNPLQVIALNSDVVNHLIDAGDKEKAHKTVTVMQNEAVRLSRRINAMVEMATESGNLENHQKINITEMLTHCADIFQIEAEKRGIGFRSEIAPGLPDVHAVAEQLERVPLNLLSNALNSTQSGEITFAAVVKNNFVNVSVTDTGEGIQADLLPQVFERGVSGKGGKGFGLSMCKIIVEAHGGEINIVSEPDKGTTASFTIPPYGGQREEVKHGE